MIMAGCQNNDSTPEDSNIETDDEFFGEYVDDELGIVYVLNENGTYSIKQGNYLLESGDLELSDDDSSRAIRKNGKKKATHKPSKSGGAKGSTKKPSASKSSVTKSSSGNTNIGNTTFSKKGTSSSSRISNQIIYVQSDSKTTPKLYIHDNGDNTISERLIKGTYTGKSSRSGKTIYKWYKFTIKNSVQFYGKIVRGNYSRNIYTTSERVISIDATGSLSYSKPAGVRSASTEESEYNGNDYLWYVQGNFTADTSKQWEALNDYNNMKEIAEGVVMPNRNLD